MQWSRRFIGLKVFLSLAVAGWEGFEETVRHMTAMGAHLKAALQADGWRIENDTPLPVVCFTGATHPEGAAKPYLEAIVKELVTSGRAWISSTVLAGVQPALRACITNYRTQASDVEALAAALREARARVVSSY
jgi:hypothetical protein